MAKAYYVNLVSFGRVRNPSTHRDQDIVMQRLRFSARGQIRLTAWAPINKRLWLMQLAGR
jgi:hypothetical protein